MDFLKLLKSLEEFLYELCTWLLFFPRTLYRVIVSPMRMAQYVELELHRDAQHQYDDAISPPLFLMLAVLVAHGVEILMHQTQRGSGALSHLMLDNEEALLLYRSVSFALWPLIAAIHLLRRRKVPITRESLRIPFFTQCYLAAPFAIVLSTSLVFVRMPGTTSTLIGLAAATLGAIWYAVVQAVWLKAQLGKGWGNTVLSTLWIMALGVVVNSVIGYLLVQP